jgi:DNA mismatch repair ATPase MutS
MATPVSLYEEKQDYYRSKLQSEQKRLNLIALLRITVFVVLSAGIYFSIKNFQIGILIVTILLLSAFIGLVLINSTVRKRKLLYEQLLFINSNELSVLQNLPNRFDDGQQFVSPESYLADLDIFGPRSVFHLLNRTTTSHGREQLAFFLQNPISKKADIEDIQQAIRILVQKSEKRQMITASGLLYGEKEENLNSVTSWLNTPNQVIQRKWVLLLRWILPVYNLWATYFYLSTGISLPFVIALALTWLLLTVFSKYVSEQHRLISKKQETLDQYTAILHEFGNTDANSSSRLQELVNTSIEARQSIAKLSKLANAFDRRLNLVVNIFLNSLFLYDIQVIFALENWKLKNKDRFQRWINCVGMIEYLNSVATFAFNNPGYAYPSVGNEKIFIDAIQMAHPLIPEKERIANDFSIGKNEKFNVITGSNMSGKTTFLRTVGVNLLLAQCGAPVCAKVFSFAPMNLLSAIRISDSLQEHTSYFMAELKRLHQIVQQLQNGVPALVLVDEILRGTNSDDKTQGSEQFIRKLLQYECLVLFATHDLNLSRLENEFPSLVSNFCFESTIQEGELYFDYKLRKGIAKNKNASFLMRKMEII